MATYSDSSINHRIEVIDVLRGFTLFGIILAHMVDQYYAGGFPESVTKDLVRSIPDTIAEAFVGIFVTGKFYMIFSFLFGLSFFIQFSKASGEQRFVFRFTWRLIILFAIGMIHQLHYRGDILTIYAVLGLGLLLCYRLPDKPLLILSIALIINIPSIIIRLLTGLISDQANYFNMGNQEELMAYYKVITEGGYTDLFLPNLYSMKDKLIFQYDSGRIFITFGLFLLGLYAGRKQFFEQLDEHLPWLKYYMKLSAKIIGGAILFTLVLFGGSQLLHLYIPEVVNWSVGGFLYDLFNACLALIYTGAIIRMYQSEKWRKKLHHLYEAGRMGLTTYLIQTVAGIFIFYNIGLGLLLKIGPAIAVPMGILIFIVQIILSKVWFRYFYYGPFEWIWRCLTLLRWQPILRNQKDPAAVA